MANAEQYAQWIVENEGRKGTPEFDIVAQAYKLARETPAAKTEPDSPMVAAAKSAAKMAFLPQTLGMKAGQLLEHGADIVGSGVTEGLSQAGAPTSVAAGAGTLANIGTQAIPTVFGGGIGRMAAPLMEKGGETLMRAALKPSTTLPAEKTAQAVKTMLTADVGNILPGANVTPGGIAQIHSKIKDFGTKVDDILNQSSAQVSRAGIANATDKTRAKFGNQFTPEADLRAIQEVEDAFLKSYPSLIPIKQAHDLKKGTYAVLGDKAYKGELKAAETETQKALAMGARMETEKGAPRIAPLNAEQSNLIGAVKAAISRDAVAGNKDPIGLGFLAANPIAAAAFMANRSEYIKSLLARAIYSTAKPVSTAAGAAAGAVVGEKSGRTQ